MKKITMNHLVCLFINMKYIFIILLSCINGSSPLPTYEEVTSNEPPNYETAVNNISIQIDETELPIQKQTFCECFKQAYPELHNRIKIVIAAICFIVAFLFIFLALIFETNFVFVTLILIFVGIQVGLMVR